MKPVGSERVGSAAPRGIWTTAGLFLLLVVLVYADPLFLRKNFAGRDLLGYHLPIEKAVHDAYGRGRLPVWISEISGGRPLLANPNVGALYPARPLLSGIPFPTAMRIFPLMHWVLAGVGMLLLVRSLGMSRSASWLGAVTYVFSGVGVTEVFYTNNHPGVALLPWVVWATTRNDWTTTRRIFFLSLFLGIDLLAGDVFTIGSALLASLLWIVLELEASRRVRELVILGISFGLAFLIALPQLIASALWIPYTQRAVVGFHLDEAFRLSLGPLRLVELLVPYPFGESWRLDAFAGWGIAGRTAGFFPTIYAGAFAFIAIFSAWRSQARGRRLAQSCFLASLALAVPGSLIPAAWKSWRSPLPLRHPEKLAVLTVFGLAVFVALGWEQLRVKGRAPRWTLIAGAILAAVALGARVFPAAAGRIAVALSGGEAQVFPIAVRQVAPALAEGGLLWMATVIALSVTAWRSAFATPVALFLLTAVPIIADRRIARTFRQEEVLAPTAFARTIQRKDPAGRYRTLALPASLSPGSSLGGQDVEGLEIWRRGWLYDTPALWGRGTVFNQDADGGDLARATSLRQLATAAAGFRDAQAFFGSLSLRWEIRFRGDPIRAGYHRIGGDRLQDWDEHDSAYPDLRLLTRWREEATAFAAVRALPRLASGEIVIETGVEKVGAAPRGSIRILERTAERMRVETDALAPTWLFALRGYFPFRDITIDGRSVEASPAQLAFSAIPVPAGRHRIDWKEELPGAAFSWWGPALYGAIAAIAFSRSALRMGRS